MRLRGYALMIGVLAVLLLVAYATAQWFAAKGTYFVTGLAPILATVFLCFCLVCLFDAIFDRVSGRIKTGKTGPAKEVPKP